MPKVILTNCFPMPNFPTTINKIKINIMRIEKENKVFFLIMYLNILQ